MYCAYQNEKEKLYTEIGPGFHKNSILTELNVLLNTQVKRFAKYL